MTAHYMLMSSLPSLGRHYKIKQLSISERQLKKRINFLSPTEKNILTDLIEILWKTWFNPELSFASTLEKANQQLLSVKNTFIQDLVQWFFDIRSLVVALRFQAEKITPPELFSLQFSHRVAEHLKHHWQEPEFGLKRRYPEISLLKNQLNDHQAKAAEESLLDLLWKHLNKIEGRHYFDFEAVIIYCFRWHIQEYWISWDEKKAEEIIQTFYKEIFQYSISTKNNLEIKEDRVYEKKE